MLTFLFIIIAIVVLLPMFRFVGFFISNGLSGDLAEIRRKAGPLSYPVLRSAVTAMMAEPYALFSFPLALLPEAEQGPKPGTPVIMVHGLYHNRTAWHIMRPRLEKAGITNLHTYHYNSFTKDFETAVVGLLRKIDTVLAGQPDAKVVLIGHSLGGLVCRAAAGNPQYRHRIGGLVALGSPHGGSDLAWLGGNSMARGLIPGRHISKAVGRLPDPDCPRLAIFTLTDDFVFPLSTLKPNREGWEEQLCSPMGHVWMLYSREIADRVIDFLKRIPTQ